MSIADQIKGHCFGLEEYQPGETRYYTIDDNGFLGHVNPVAQIMTQPNMPRGRSLLAHPTLADLIAVLGIDISSKVPNIAVMTKDQLDRKAAKDKLPQVVVIEYSVVFEAGVVIDWWTVKA